MICCLFKIDIPLLFVYDISYLFKYNSKFVEGFINLAKTLKWCIRRKYQWLRGKRPGFATTLVQIVGLIINDYGNLKNKWNERRSGNLRTNIDMNPQLVELEL